MSARRHHLQIPFLLLLGCLSSPPCLCLMQFTKVTLMKDKYFELASFSDPYSTKSSNVCSLRCIYTIGSTKCLSFQYSEGDNNCSCGFVDYDNAVFNVTAIISLMVGAACIEYGQSKFTWHNIFGFLTATYIAQRNSDVLSPLFDSMQRKRELKEWISVDVPI